jgi:Protein of unknown function (DUF1674)
MLDIGLGKQKLLRYRNAAMTNANDKPISKRPVHLAPPPDMPKNPPVPMPEPMTRAAEPDPDRLDPVRYGDWEYKGIAIDF